MRAPIKAAFIEFDLPSITDLLLLVVPDLAKRAWGKYSAWRQRPTPYWVLLVTIDTRRRWQFVRVMPTSSFYGLGNRKRLLTLRTFAPTVKVL